MPRTGSYTTKTTDTLPSTLVSEAAQLKLKADQLKLEAAHLKLEVEVAKELSEALKFLSYLLSQMSVDKDGRIVLEIEQPNFEETKLGQFLLESFIKALVGENADSIVDADSTFADNLMLQFYQVLSPPLMARQRDNIARVASIFAKLNEACPMSSERLVAARKNVDKILTELKVQLRVLEQKKPDASRVRGIGNTLFGWGTSSGKRKTKSVELSSNSRGIGAAPASSSSSSALSPSPALSSSPVLSSSSSPSSFTSVSPAPPASSPTPSFWQRISQLPKMAAKKWKTLPVGYKIVIGVGVAFVAILNVPIIASVCGMAVASIIAAKHAVEEDARKSEAESSRVENYALDGQVKSPGGGNVGTVGAKPVAAVAATAPVTAEQPSTSDLPPNPQEQSKAPALTSVGL